MIYCLIVECQHNSAGSRWSRKIRFSTNMSCCDTQPCLEAQRPLFGT